MSTKTKAPNGTATKEDLAIAASMPNDAVNGQISKITFDQAWDLAENADATQLEDLTASYLSFDDVAEGEVKNLLFEGMGTATLEGQEKRVAKFKDREGNALISASTVIVGSCSNITTIPTFVRLIYKGKAKNKQGKSYDNVQVFALPGANK